MTYGFRQFFPRSFFPRIGNFILAFSLTFCLRFVFYYLGGSYRSDMSDFNHSLSQLINWFLTLFLKTSARDTKRSTPKNRYPSSALRTYSYFGLFVLHALSKKSYKSEENSYPPKKTYRFIIFWIVFAWIFISFRLRWTLNIFSWAVFLL